MLWTTFELIEYRSYIETQSDIRGCTLITLVANEGGVGLVKITRRTTEAKGFYFLTTKYNMCYSKLFTM